MQYYVIDVCNCRDIKADGMDRPTALVCDRMNRVFEGRRRLCRRRSRNGLAKEGKEERGEGVGVGAFGYKVQREGEAE